MAQVPTWPDYHLTNGMHPRSPIQFNVLEYGLLDASFLIARLCGSDDWASKA
ncbi:hypothetical protein SCARR_01753 [Pontiella sulfatireligans]|uniref:Uncharacterized protein n=1 Tax=Pontiella sulfatireligans TaxID=2750658 RepID=A0A6C2UK56_9BACT|nr:hypothetical protein SCARR_01753 [Pontiella sulfatireligans]